MSYAYTHTYPHIPSCILFIAGINQFDLSTKKERGKHKKVTQCVTTLSELKEQIPDNDHRQFELGYYEPGHGTKAKKDG